MKIAVVTATFPPYRGGTGHVAYHNAWALAERGHAVTVWTADRGGAAGAALPFRVVRVAPAAAVGNAPWIPRLARRLGKADVVHVHYPDIFGAIAAARAARQGSTRLVMTLHNRLVDGSPPGAALGKAGLFWAYERWATPWLFRRAAALVTMSEDHFHTWQQLHPCVRVVPHGVDGALFRPRPRGTMRRRLGLPADALVLLFVGALDAAHRFKNLPLLLAALPYVADSAVLLVAGDGDQRTALERAARRLGVGRRVWFAGSQEPQALPMWYGAADATVLPSVSTESFGLVLLESLAMQIPVVATSLPGVRTVVRPGQDGLLVDPGSLESMVRGLRALARRPQLREQMGRRGRQRVVHEYSWRSSGEKLERLFLDLVSARTGVSLHGPP